MKKLLIILLLLCPIAFGQRLPSSGQKSTKAALEKTMEYVNSSFDNGDRYKGQKASDGARTGLGIYKWSDGDYYLGNFSNSKIDGYGMNLVQDGYNVSNCNDCIVYVGNYSSDNKSGKGTCYDKNGNLIYYGFFSNNKPDDAYPSTSNYSSYKFKAIDYESGNKYIGETKDGKRSGYGVFVWASGDAWLGNWENDSRKGKGIYLWHNAKKWQTENCDGDDCTTIASSSGNSSSYSNNNSGNNNSSSYNSNNYNASFTCTVCGGTGRSLCVLCGGTGQQFSTGVVGIDYYGNLRYGQTLVSCNMCYGSGRTTCLACNGLGKIIPASIPITPITPIAPSGNSYDGGSYGGGGYESGNSNRRIKCKSCNGSGICKHCGGNYATNCSYCDGVGKKMYGYGSNARYETCAVCNGSGKSYCAICYGTFHIRGKCGDCKGRGYID